MQVRHRTSDFRLQTSLKIEINFISLFLNYFASTKGANSSAYHQVFIFLKSLAISYIRSDGWGL